MAGCNEFSVTLADRGVRISEMVCATHGYSSWWAWPRGRAGGCDMGGVVAVCYRYDRGELTLFSIDSSKLCRDMLLDKGKGYKGMVYSKMYDMINRCSD